MKLTKLLPFIALLFAGGCSMKHTHDCMTCPLRHFDVTCYIWSDESARIDAERVKANEPIIPIEPSRPMGEQTILQESRAPQ